MTKKFWILCLMTILCINASAQSLVGKWATEPEKEDGVTTIYMLNFKDKTNIELGVECDMSDEEMAMSFEILVDGKYKRDGDKLTIDFNHKDAKFNLKKMKFLGEEAEMFNNNPELEETMKKIIIEAVEAQKETLLEELPTQGDLTIYELTSTTLKIGGLEDVSKEFKKVK